MILMGPLQLDIFYDSVSTAFFFLYTAITNFMPFLHKMKSQYLLQILLLNQESYLENICSICLRTILKTS